MEPVRNADSGNWNQPDWAQMVASVNELESAWREAPFPDLARFLPAIGDAARDRILVELIKVDQECRWRLGEGKVVEFYLQAFPELAGNTTALVDLLSAECWTRATFDVVPSALELKSRFSTVSGRIDLAAILSSTEAEGHGRRIHKPMNGNQPSFSTPEDAIEIGDTSDLSPGSLFGRFRIHGTLGRGSMGTVYRAYDGDLAREVALKIPSFEQVTESDAKDQFLEEARAAARIRHPNICPIYEAGQIDGRYYIVMALLEGETLSSWMKRHPLSSEQATAIVCKIAKALDKLHNARIVHRDIKPQNIVIDENGEPLLMDFGLSSHLGKLASDMPDGLVGTPAYMSPEQVLGNAVDHRSDIYSLGAVLYQLLTGQLPFSGTLYDVLTRIVQSQPVDVRMINSDVDQSTAGICIKAMAKQPSDRYQTAGELAGALERREMPKPSRRQGVFRGQLRSQRSLVLASVIFCSLLAIWLAFWGTTRPRNPSSIDETPSQAKVLDLGKHLRVSRESEIKNWREKRWFRVDTVKPGILLLETLTPTHDFDGNLSVFDSKLNELVEDGNSGIGPDSLVLLPVKDRETYFACVTSTRRQVGPFLILASQPEVPPQGEPFFTERGQHVNDTFGDQKSDAHQVVLMDSGFAAEAGSIWPEGDEDWFVVAPSESGVMIIRPETPHSSLDTLLEIYDEASLLARHRDRIVSEMNAGQKHFIRISGEGGGGSGFQRTGNYVLRMRFLQSDLVTPTVRKAVRSG